MTPVSHPSPNCGPRRGGVRPNLIVLHYTAMPGAEPALKRLCLPEAEVSAHYLIGRCGTVWQLVDEDLRAWHAGAGEWGDIEDVNSRSIGIELDNDGDSDFAEPQMVALMALLPGIMARWGIAPERVIGHSDMAPGRKIDPGARFDWPRLARAGLSVWPDEVELAGGVPDEARFVADLLAFGYPQAPFETLLAAFRLRFRPGQGGALTREDCAIAAALARRWPVGSGAVDGGPAGA